MIIEVRGIKEERFFHPLQLIAGLFFEEAQVLSTKTECPQLIVDFKLRVGERAFVEGAIEGKDIQASCERPIVHLADEKETRKQVKNMLCYVFLSLLQQTTGIQQKWGILTGVRPTKLMHKKLREGMRIEEIQRDLKNNYLLSGEKIQLMEQIVQHQLKVLPDLYQLKNEVSIYIGIPFCPTKCAYCTFPAYAIHVKKSLVDGFLEGLHQEIKEIGQVLKEKGIRITTVYFGGGTPTSISAEQMDALYEQMYRYFPNMDEIREVTVEAGRPDTITEEKLAVLKKWNIDRISVNPQSYHQETLKAIGRHHTVAETINKFHLAKEMGMSNINMDLIIGLPGENLDIFEKTLLETEKLMPESLTVHTLSFKRASEMTKNKQKYQVASSEEVEEMMGRAEQWATDHHYHPYYLYRQKNILGNLENVGYSQEGQESLYNILIMEEVQTILGLGCGAASKFIHPQTGKIERFANPKDPATYNNGYEHYVEEKIKKIEELY